MSKRRNRRLSHSKTSQESQTRREGSFGKQWGVSTGQSILIPGDRENDAMGSGLRDQQRLFKVNNYPPRNISFFRENFNPNDPSQLPFMSSLRIHSPRPPLSSRTLTPSGFQHSQILTANQTVRKKTSDFNSQQKRLSLSSYRWHNRSGLNNKYEVDF